MIPSNKGLILRTLAQELRESQTGRPRGGQASRWLILTGLYFVNKGAHEPPGNLGNMQTPIL